MNSREFDEPELSQDARRLLYAISAYSNPVDDFSKRVWMKVDTIYVLALLGVKAKVFSDYDVSPSLFPFRGVKMFAMLSQEAIDDVNTLFHAHLIDKIVLSTWYYDTITAVAINQRGAEVMARQVLPEDRRAVSGLIRCSSCQQPVDFAVAPEEFSAERTGKEVNLVMHKVCKCHTKSLHTSDDGWHQRRAQSEPIAEFFSIGEVEYSAEPYFMG
jgi:hypothetical protein